MGDWRGTITHSISPEFGEWFGIPADKFNVLMDVYDAAMLYCELMREFDVDMPYPNAEEVPYKKAAIAECYKEMQAACRAAKEVERGR